MSRLLGVVILCLAGWWLLADKLPGPESPSELTELQEGFAGQADAARLWAGLLGGLARVIEADGTLPEPMLKSMDDIEQLRDLAVRAPIKPVPGGQLIGQVLGPELNQVGGAGAELTSARRERVVQIFLDASQALEVVQ